MTKGGDEPKQSDPAEVTGGRGARLSFGQRLRAYLFAGILVTAPIFITFYLAYVIVTFVDSKITPLIPAQYNPETYLPFALPGLGLVVLILALILVGAVTASFFGRLWVRISDRLLSQMPVIRNVHSAVKQILETILAQQSNAFREAVLIEYPRRGIWAIGFLTGQTKGEVQNLTEEDCINVFLPTTPNPTSGFLLFVPSKDLIRLDMNVEDAIKMVISGGIVTPPDRRPEAERNTPVTSAAAYEALDIAREREGGTVLLPPGSRAGERQDAAKQKKDDD